MSMVGQRKEWQKFEDKVLLLLRLAGYDVQPEQLVTYKKADLVFDETHLGSRRRVVVECKAYEKPLTQEDVSQILANYQPLYDKGFIDQLLLVTLRGLSPSAIAMVNASRLCSHLTLLELETSIMDFTPYILGLIAQFREDGLDQYYISPRHDDVDLETYVRSWLEKPEQPLAILGSYGMGKTSFARHLSAALAEEHIENSTKRIPIFLRLGEISSEQSLEGLLGKAFTALSLVKNYNFHAFMALNNLGRFVIFLDGFDEMKHTLTWEQCRFNFRQLNRLVSPNSRVILLGRPTAFLSEEEQNQALHGFTKVGGNVFREPEWPDYKELTLAPFNKDQVETFLTKYFAFKLSHDLPVATRHRIEGALASKIGQVSSKQLSDIARRPVQLKMIAEILPEWDEDLSALTVSILYSHFIDLMLKREAEKLSRQRFSISDRRQFALGLAWWLWTTKQGVSLTAEDIPDEYLKEFCRPGEKLEVVRRDLVAACFLEKKEGGALYFPHRSFQEYLVAEAICDGLTDSGTITVADAESVLTDELASFASEMLSPQLLLRWESKLSAYHGMLSARFIQMLIFDPRHARHVCERLKSVRIPWYLLACILAVTRGTLPSGTRNELLGIFSSGQVRKRGGGLEQGQILYALLCHLCITGLPGVLPEEIIASLLRLVRLGADQELDPDNPEKWPSKVIVDQRVFLLLSRIVVNKKRPKADMRGTYSVLCECLSEYCMIREWVVGSTIRTDDVVFHMELSSTYEWEFDELNEVLNKL